MSTEPSCLPDGAGFDMDSGSSNLVPRLDTLEARFTQQEVVIADLNEMITMQWSQIEALQRQVLQLREELRDMAPPRDRSEPPPPHY